MRVLLALHGVISRDRIFVAYLIYPLAALTYGFLPGAAFFLPVALVGLWVARRTDRVSKLGVVAVGTIGAGAISVALLSYSGFAVTIYSVGTFACAGGVGALTYYGVRSYQLKREARLAERRAESGRAK